MSGTATAELRRNVANLPITADPANLLLLAVRGAGETVRLDIAAVPGNGNGAGGGGGGAGLLSGSGPPAATLGAVGEYYMDTASASDRVLYGPKTEAGWGPGLSLRGAPGQEGDGSAFLFGAGPPPDTLGSNGDVYLDEASVNYALYGPKTAGVWPAGTRNLRGPAGSGSEPGPQGDPGLPGAPGTGWRAGNGPPNDALGINGDFYADLATEDLRAYGPKAAGVWPTASRPLRGPQGLKGDPGPAGQNAAVGATAPAALGPTAQAGTAATAARSDHVHPRPTPSEIGAAPAEHTQSVDSITGLAEALSGKAPSNHLHAIADVSGLDTALGGKIDAAARGALQGVAPLVNGKVPAENLPAASGSGSGSTANLANGTADGQVAVWNHAAGQWQPETQRSIVADRTPTHETNAAGALDFGTHNRRSVVISEGATAPKTLSATEIGTGSAQGMEFAYYNDSATTQTVTFGAGIEVDQPASGTGTAGQVKVAGKSGARRGKLYVTVLPMGSKLVAVCEGDVV